VDKGAQDGIFVGQAVLDAGGVFGQVARIEQLTSEVILVSDPAHAIPVQINRNGLRTIAVGTGDPNRLKLPFLPTSADVIVGDLLVTSGLGGGFPPGYPVGTISEVRRDPAQSLAEVAARPAAHLDRSRELMFVWLKPGAVLPTTPGGLMSAAAGSAAGVATGAGATGAGATGAGATGAGATAAAAGAAKSKNAAATATKPSAPAGRGAAASVTGRSVSAAGATSPPPARSNAAPETPPPAPRSSDPNDE
jgi:rod shape-determining protein MreC